MTNKLIDDIRNNLDDGKINSEKLFAKKGRNMVYYNVVILEVKLC